MDNPVIVAGVSGSPASARALRWAADEARRRQGQLKVVFAWRIEPRAFYAPSLAPQDLAARQRRARDETTAMIRAVLGPGLSADVTTEVTEGNPERALVDASAGADLLVLGAASGQLPGRSLGPVVRTCLLRAHCPVVVVGPEGRGAQRRNSARSANLVADPADGRQLLPAGAQPA